MASSLDDVDDVKEVLTNSLGLVFCNFISLLFVLLLLLLQPNNLFKKFNTREIQKTAFGTIYSNGGIPCRLVHGSVKNRLMWNQVNYWQNLFN